MPRIITFPDVQNYCDICRRLGNHYVAEISWISEPAFGLIETSEGPTINNERRRLTDMSEPKIIFLVDFTTQVSQGYMRFRAFESLFFANVILSKPQGLKARQSKHS